MITALIEIKVKLSISREMKQELCEGLGSGDSYRFGKKEEKEHEEKKELHSRSEFHTHTHSAIEL